MSNPTPEELETQRQEQLSIKQEIATAKENVKLGKELAELRAMPQFKNIFDKLFVDDGRRFLWENINHAEEQLMISKRPDTELARGEKMIRQLKREVDGRLVFDTFLNTIERDYADGVEALEELLSDQAGEE